jgi:hypothetical protein
MGVVCGGWILHFSNLIRDLGDELGLFLKLSVEVGHILSVLSGS